MPIAQNAALFSLLGTTYGGNGTTTFGLPDLRGRVPIHRGDSFAQGELAGEEQVAITQSTMPLHNHALLATTALGDKKNSEKSTLAASSDPANFYYSPTTGLVQLNSNSIAMVGNGQPHQNMQPFLVISFCIATSGVFPSRN